MRSIIFLCFAICFSFQSIAQDTIVKSRVKKFISLEAYKKMFGKPSDTTEFMLRGKDTMVMVSSDFDISPGKDKIRVEYEPKDSTFLSIYKNVVYNTHKSQVSKECMRYWKDDIRIYFDKSVPVAHTKELMDFAEEVSKGIDSLNISRNFVREKSNYIVYYLNNDNLTDYDPRIANSKGGYYVSWNKKQQIYDGKLKINTELVDSELLQIQLLKYHFFKSLGFFYSSDQLECESYLSGCRTMRTLTPEDLEILKYHYSYGVCKGTNLENFDDLTTRLNKQYKEHPNSKIYIIHNE